MPRPPRIPGTAREAVRSSRRNSNLERRFIAQDTAHTDYQQNILDGMPDKGAYWPLDDTGVSLMADIGPNGENGVYVNNPTLQVAPLIGDGKAVAFHGGSSTYGWVAHVGSGLVGTAGSWTVGCWIETTQTSVFAGADASSRAFIVSADDNAMRYFQFRMNPATGLIDVVAFSAGGATYVKTGAIVVNDGVRHFVAARYDAGANEITLWIDGAQDGAAVTGPTSPSLTVGNIVIGARKPSAFFGGFFDGTIDEVFLYGDTVPDSFFNTTYQLGFNSQFAGSKWYFGAGPPSDSLGNNGDFYEDTTNGNIYEKVAGTWGSPIANSTIINPGDIGTTELSDGSVTAAKLSPSITGNNGKWLRLSSGALAWEAISADEVSITDTGGYFTSTDVEGALQELGAGGGGGGSPTGAAGGALDGTYPNPGIASSVAGNGLSESADVLSVNVDGTTIEINTDTLRLKDTGPGATGPIGDGTHVAVVTINAKGQVTALSSAAISFPTPTDVAVPTPSATTTGDGIKRDFTAGETLAFGDPVYIKSDGKVWKGDADTASTFPVMGMAMGAAAANATVTVLLLGIARNDSWTWTVGGIVYLSTSSGLTQTQPSSTDNAIQIIGIAEAATRIYVNPQLVWITHT